MASYNTSEFRKGLKVQLDGDPYLMIECNFVKPGKGQALYKCKLRNLLRNTVLDRTYKSGDSLEAADIEEIQAQYLYHQGDHFVFMDNATYEQYELTAGQVDETWKYLKEARSSVRPVSGSVAQADLSLDTTVDEEGDITHLDRIEDDGPGPEERFLSAEGDRGVRDTLHKVRKRIGELGWDIVHHRLTQDEPTTLEDLGKRWGVSRERVRQVELRAKSFLHRVLEQERDAA